MKSVAASLKSSRLFSRLSETALLGVLENAVQVSGEKGAHVAARPADVVIVLEGGIEMRSREGRLLAAINADASAGEPGVLHAIQPGARLTMTRPTQALVVDGTVLDNILSQMHQADSLSSLADTIADRVAVLIHAQPFAQMTLDQICRCAEAMTRRSAAAGEDVIRYAGHGDYFYVIEDGEAEVWRPDARTGDLIKVATLQKGASFGEEALLRGGLRNATIRMATPGSLLCLSVADFDRLIADHFVQDVAPEVAQSLLTRRQADLVDCRYDDEYAVWRIPNARLMPLDRLRTDAAQLDKSRQVIVYCRSGRRSRAAAFILRQEGFTAMFLAGGIANWPYEHEGERGSSLPGVPPV
ncbi:MAG: cyclic nucleotide-binding domain-containing protein [Hyphomicrobiaceae bacterium]